MNSLPRPSPGACLLAAGIHPIRPGEFVATHILAPRGLTPADAAAAMGITATAVEGLVKGDRLDGAMAECLASFTGISDGFWLNLQAAYHLATRIPSQPPDGRHNL